MADFDELLAGYDYVLPPEQIAQQPLPKRDKSRLLKLVRRTGVLEHGVFTDLPEWLSSGDLLVFNDTRVIPARLFGEKLPGGGRAELLLVRDLGTGRWEALVGATGRKRAGQLLDLGDGFRAELIAPVDGPTWEVAIAGPAALSEFLEQRGHVPLPPYIRRPDRPADRERYQTIFARAPGAVAAPTAGLHFTPALLASIAARGVATAWVTLHVGPGTFRPLEPEDLARGELHAEDFILPVETAAAIGRTRAAGGRIVAVGTTTTRVLEARALDGGGVAPGAGRTRLFLQPPHEPRVVDGLITNFHLPRSSLLMLVACFAGRTRILAAYAEAIAAGYRFYSYGDAMLITPGHIC